MQTTSVQFALVYRDNLLQPDTFDDISFTVNAYLDQKLYLNNSTNLSWYDSISVVIAPFSTSLPFDWLCMVYVNFNESVTLAQNSSGVYMRPVYDAFSTIANIFSSANFEIVTQMNTTGKIFFKFEFNTFVKFYH